MIQDAVPHVEKEVRGHIELHDMMGLGLDIVIYARHVVLHGMLDYVVLEKQKILFMKKTFTQCKLQG